MPTSESHPYARLEAALLVGVGGFAGSNLRYAVDLALPSTLTSTLAVNVLGSFALGVVLYESLRVGVGTGRARLVLATGFLSSFTTFSTFVLEAVSTDALTAVGYVLVSYALGFAAVLAGRAVVTTAMEGPA